MDHLFGSVGTAQREKERWDEVYLEVGLAELLERSGLMPPSEGKEPPSYQDDLEKEKPSLVEKV